MPKLLVRGERSEEITDKEERRAEGILKVKCRASVRIATSREAEGRPIAIDVKDSDVVALELEGGFKLWIRGNDFQKEFGPKTKRGAKSDEWELSPELVLGSQTRGIGSWILKGLEIFDVNVTGTVAKEMARYVESKLDQKPGLYAVNLGEKYELNPLPSHLPTDKPLLIFLHGTASSTSGSFGQLWQNRKTRELLQGRYNGNAFAFEHRTLTESPIQNAIDLAKALPDKATLHFVSHSRGGLVGELLCRGQRTEGRDPFERRELESLTRAANEKADPDGEALAKAFTDLNGILKRKHIKVERFVRVACPSRGTTLASERLDRWFSVILNLFGQVPLINGNPLFEALKDFLLALVREHTKPKDLPGLAAMMPDSPIVRILNLPDVNVDADLSVISGDSEGERIWGRLKLLIPDLFFGGDNDLVVNTGSMYGGANRKPGARFFLDQGEGVNHFNYFANEKTAMMITEGLTRPEGWEAGFIPIEKARQEVPLRSAPSRGGPQPVVIIIPGIMGSHLAADGDRIWLNLVRIAFGGLSHLAIDAARIEPQNLIYRAYGNLVDYLKASHTVRTFPYDWRLSIREAAKRLADAVNSELASAEKDNQPVRLLAHSMGGLVARAMIVNHPEVWQRICRHTGGRLVMLGTPNLGSHEIVRLLVGQSEILHNLALLDITNSKKGLLEIISRYPGILEMLPEEQGNNYFSAAFWDGLKTSDQHGDWALPEQDRLQDAAKCRQAITGKALDADRVLYVAGCARATPCGYRIISGDDRKKKIEFQATARGDGRVPWDTGIPAEVKRWYMEDVEHGDLADHEPAFPALLELLQSGQTKRLSSTEPAAARGVTEIFRMSPTAIPMVPDEEALTAVVIGSHRREKTKSHAAKIKVSITHGDLGYVRHAVAVGHYQGDTIVGAEKYLDRKLNKRLSNFQRFELYPGQLGSNAVLINPDPYAKPGGALIIGLGKVGELSPAALATSFARALSAYVLEIAESSNERFHSAQGVPRSAKITSLLIGTGAGGITVEESVNAILRGALKVSDLLQDTGRNNDVSIEELEFVELWQDVAIQAGRALEKVKDDPGLRDYFNFDLHVRESTGGLQRVNREDDPEWWHRLQILADKNGELRFNAVTGSARTEVSLLPTQRTLVDQFVEQAVATTSNSSETSRTLFELLLPNRLKEQAANRLKMVLLLNEESARYPWELLDDRLAGSSRPSAVESGVIRQLEASEFREKVHMAIDNSICVVGDPISNFTPLPGAEAEAQLVADQFAAQGFKVERRIRSDAMSIVTALHARAYRILHLAGHGIHDELLDSTHKTACEICGQSMPVAKPTKVSGMIIGKNIFLTPADVNQMRQVPELVFINCCHLGRTDTEEEEKLRKDRHKLAANVAAQFIRMGVRAVVAAGWAVEDEAAKTFAREFYAAMLNDTQFGEAVRMARSETYDRYPGVNTWGAYQCYGDPDYRLRVSDHRRNIPSIGKSYVSPAEMTVELRNISSKTQGAGYDRIQELKEELDGILKRSDPSWLSCADVASALGLAYGELGDFEKAVGHLDKALEANKAELSIRAVEQRANFKCRWAVSLSQAGLKGPGGRKPDNMIKEAISELNCLKSFAPTEERWNMLGSAYKRCALIASTGAERKKALALTTDYYKKAHELVYSGGKGKVDPYPLLNWLTGEILGAWHGARQREVLPKIDAWCKKAEAIADAKDKVDPDFWNSLAISDARLVCALVHDNLGKDIETIYDGYKRAKERGASPLQFSSVLENLDFVIQLISTASKKKKLQALLKALQELKEKLVVLGGQ